MYPSEGGEFKPLEYPTNVSSILKKDMPVIAGYTIKVDCKSRYVEEGKKLNVIISFQ